MSGAVARSLGTDDDGEVEATVDSDGRLDLQAYVVDKESGERRREYDLDGLLTVDQVEALRVFLNELAAAKATP